MKAKTGDSVEVITKDESYKGILLPRPEILDKDIVVLKLANGYNIGIENNKIKEIKLLEPYKPKKVEAKVKQKKGLPKVLFLSAGGTISSRIDYRTGGVAADYSADDFLRMVPELSEIANLKAEKILDMMSEDFTSEDWQLIARKVISICDKYDGIVITQGTDTLHYTASALSFFLKGIDKPVVLTASQRSIDRGSSDAFMNLICAVHAAVTGPHGVYTCMHATSNDDYCALIRGTKVRKMHTSKRNAFMAINDEPVAFVYPDGKIDLKKKVVQVEKEFNIDFEKKVGIVYVYPGISPDVIDYYVKKGYKGIVLAATALGHVPTAKKEYSLLPALENATKKGVAVVIATQTVYGRVNPYVYTNLRKLSMQLGAIFVSDMLVETAYVKLGWVLARSSGIDETRKLMQTNLVGEISDRSLFF